MNHGKFWGYLLFGNAIVVLARDPVPWMGLIACFMLSGGAVLLARSSNAR